MKLHIFVENNWCIIQLKLQYMYNIIWIKSNHAEMGEKGLIIISFIETKV